jgi:hypothetical protein
VSTERKDFTEKQFDETLQELRQQEVWNVVPPEQPYGSLEALLGAEIGCGEQEAKRQLEAQATGSTPKGGRPKTADSAVLSQAQRAKSNGIGRDSQRKLDYLAGNAPALLDQVKEGVMSIHRAYTQARGIQETPLTTLHRVWRQVSPDERLRFLVEMLARVSRS